VYRQLDRRLDLDQQIDHLREEGLSRATSAVDPALRALGGALSFLGALAAIWGITIFMLFFGERLVKALLDEATPSHRERYRRVLHEVYRAVGGYLSGLGVICGCNAACTTAFLAIIRVPFFLPLGILSGLSSLVPLVGNTAVGLLITLIALATGGVTRGIACGVFFILYQQFENHVLGPLVYRKTVDVNPLITVVGLMAFAELGGIVGAILAVPVIASAQIIARELLRYRREMLNSPPDGPLKSPA
jgi:predicted PurR-regulated permease PerM